MMSFTLWVKYNNEMPVSLEIQEGTVDKLKDVVKRRLNLGKVNNGRIIVRQHEATVDLEPDVIVDQNFANTAKTPLFTTGKPLC